MASRAQRVANRLALAFAKKLAPFIARALVDSFRKTGAKGTVVKLN